MKTGFFSTCKMSLRALAEREDFGQIDITKATLKQQYQEVRGRVTGQTASPSGFIFYLRRYKFHYYALER
jgi:hypothetical protein